MVQGGANIHGASLASKSSGRDRGGRVVEVRFAGQTIPLWAVADSPGLNVIGPKV